MFERTLTIFCCLISSAYIVIGRTTIERWETVPVPPNANPRAKGGCYDVQAVKHANGEIYQRPEGKFKYTCADGVEQVYACIGSARTNGAEIPVGETLNVNGFWHKCTKNANSSVVYTQEFSCKHKDKEYKVGEIVNLGFLQMKCEEGGYKVEGCYSMDDNNGVVSTAHDGDRLGKATTKGGTRCKPHALPEKPADGGCLRSGKTYRDGETFDDTRIKYKCRRGAVEPIGCFTDKNRTLSVGEDFVDQNTVYRCLRLAGKIRYLEYGCGLSGSPSCQPKKFNGEKNDSGAVNNFEKSNSSHGIGRVVIVRP